MLEQTIAAIRPLDAEAMAAARALHARLTKPAGSLGALEELSVRLAGLAGTCPPPLPAPAAVAIFAGDHGVHAQGVTPWPQEVTAQMVANIVAGGAVVNAFARQIGASVTVVDVGVASAVDGAVGLNVRRGTRDMTVEPALTPDEAVAAVEVGIRVAGDLVDAGARALLAGEMGIANTTPAAALIAAFTGGGPAEATGRGTGVDDETYARKVDVVRRTLSAFSGKMQVGGSPRPASSRKMREGVEEVLAAVGGLEHAAIAGFILGAAARRVPVILDGVSAVAAALVAARLAPDCTGAMVAGHRSAEPGATLALRHLALDPLVDLGMRLGEGTGALLALPIVASAVRVLHDVATFDSAGVSEK
jgi:nicotinate-nucleotide--dimethylbenzimidazole phosphoribosyltransferase